MSNSDSSMSDQEFDVDSLYEKVKSRASMKVMAQEFLASSEYSAARDVLKQLLKLQDDIDSRLDTAIRIAECDVMVNRKIGRTTDRNIMRLLASSGKTCFDLQQMALQGEYLESAIAHLYACKLFKEQEEPEKALKGIESSLMKVASDTHEMFEEKNLKAKALKTYPLVIEMLNEMKQIDADAHLKVRSQPTCVAKTGYMLNILGKKHESCDVLMEGREFMQQCLGEQAQRYHTYAAMANNIAASLIRQGRFSEAADYQMKAIQEMTAAEDIDDQEKNKQLSNFNKTHEFQTHMASWIREKGVEGESIVEMACEAAFEESAQEELQNLTGSKEEPVADRFKKMREKVHKNVDSASFRELLFGELDEQMEGINTESGFADEYGDAVREVIREGSISESTEQKVLSRLDSANVTWVDVRDLAGRYDGATAMVMHYYTCRLLIFYGSPEDIFKEGQECFRHSKAAIDRIIKGKKDAKLAKKLIWLLKKMYKDLSAVPLEQCDPNLKTKAQANCLNKLGATYIQLTEGEKARNYLSKGRRLMDDSFGILAPKHSVYASLANNIAYSYNKDGEYDSSVEYYKKAIAEMQNANDISSTARRGKVSTYENGLESAKRNLAKSDWPQASTAGKPNSAKPKRLDRDAAGEQAFADDDVGWQDKNEKSFAEPTHTARGTSSTAGLANVGNNIYVDHKNPLRTDYQVYSGKVGDEEVAVKKIECTEKHKREVEIMKNLSEHPNTVEYKSWCEWVSSEIPGLKAIYLAMELCRKKTLFEMAKDKSITVRKRLEWMQQLALGLAHIHAQGIVHGDLKPHNLLLSQEESIVKVADFGISKKEEWGSHTTSVGNAGTLYWKAPDPTLTKCSDVFSAGLVYYYILSGGVMWKIGTDFREFTSTDHLLARDLITRMTDEEPAKRPTVKECLESPLFWNERQRIRFFQDFHEHLSDMPNNARVVQYTKEKVQSAVGDRWAHTLVENQGESDTREAPVTEENTLLTYVKAQMKAAERPEEEPLSFMRFMTNCIDSLRQEDNVLHGRDADVWGFISIRFPALFPTIYEIARCCGYFWPVKQKLEYLCAASSRDDLKTVIDDQSEGIFRTNWLESLTLDKATVGKIQEKVNTSKIRYKVSKYAIHNKATGNKREDEPVYDEHSAYSLLVFIDNRRKYFAADGKPIEWILGNDTEGLWNFFSTRFPNLLDDIVLRISAHERDSLSTSE